MALALRDKVPFSMSHLHYDNTMINDNRLSCILIATLGVGVSCTFAYQVDLHDILCEKF